MKVLIDQVSDKYTSIGLRLSNLRVLFIMATSIILIDTTVQQIQTMKMSALGVVRGTLRVCYVHAAESPPWTAARQAPLSKGLSRQEYWSGLPCPPPGDLPDPGTELRSLMPPALAGGFFTTSIAWEAHSEL